MSLVQQHCSKSLGLYNWELLRELHCAKFYLHALINIKSKHTAQSSKLELLFSLCLSLVEEMLRYNLTTCRLQRRLIPGALLSTSESAGPESLAPPLSYQFEDLGIFKIKSEYLY